jgi:hypothetical protein
VKRALPLALAVTLLGVAPAGAAAQFRPQPWATINACDPPQAPGSVGVRVSVPNRRDAAQWARVRVQFFDPALSAWRVVRSGGETGFAKLSDGGSRVTSGTTFTFTQLDAGSHLTLRGLVNVEWRRGRRVLDRAQVVTRGGHADAQDPLLAVSARTCQIRR